MTLTKKIMQAKQHEIDMTQGNILSNLIVYTLPLLAGILLQQLYNMVDTWVIGQDGVNAAYAAVGSVGPVINILVGFFSGLASGASVVIAQYYGAKNIEKVKRAAKTAMLMTFILAAFFTFIGIAMTPAILKMMFHDRDGTNEIYPYAKQYLTIIFAGVSGLMVYNMASGILRAVGDSVRPFYFLVVAAVINTVLDLVFVFVFKMGVAGVAYATIIAEFVSAALAMITLLRTDTCVKIKLNELKIDLSILRNIIRIGIPAALQLALTSFSNIFVQAYIAGVNMDQNLCLSAWTTYSKVDQILFLPTQAIALAVTTFVGQNLGAGDIKRAKKGISISYIMATIITVVFAILIFIFTPNLAAIFNPDNDVVHYATILLRMITPFYLFTCVNQTFAAAMRGAGDSRSPMIIMLLTFVGFRQLYLFVMTNFISNDLLPVALSYPAGWFMCTVTMLIYYKFFFSFEKSKKLS